MTQTTDFGLRYTVRYLYDLQRMRIASNNRPARQRANLNMQMSKADADFLETLGGGLQQLENEALKRIKKQLKRYPIAKWMAEQKGCGPTMSAVIIAEVDIRKCNTASSMWHYAGLSVNSETHKAVKRTKGQRISYNPFLKDKMLKVLADCFIRLGSPWRKFYDDYKHRKLSTIVHQCMNCLNKTAKEKKACKNCQGTGGPAPWGCSDMHRDRAARRYMIKMFLLELWKQWRTLEGLDVRVPYALEYLGRKHDDKLFEMQA